MFSLSVARRLIIKNTFWVICLCSVLLFSTLPSYALSLKDVPNPQKEYGGWVTDQAQLLSEEAQAQLNQIISELKRQTGDEITVVTVPETAPAPSPKALATQLFETWDISRNGVLFLVSKRDRRVEIQTGYGIESLLPRSQVSSIIQDEILPLFKQENFAGGILAGTISLATQLGGNFASLPNLAVDMNSTANSNQQSGYVALSILVISALVLPSVVWFSSISRRSGFIDSNSDESSNKEEGSNASSV
jgi:uncharacterized protein